jgi:hypothetical protein
MEEFPTRAVDLTPNLHLILSKSEGRNTYGRRQGRRVDSQGGPPALASHGAKLQAAFKTDGPKTQAWERRPTLRRRILRRRSQILERSLLLTGPTAVRAASGGFLTDETEAIRADGNGYATSCALRGYG